MAGKDRTEANSVDIFSDLANSPFEYGFYSLLREIESRYDNRPRLGDSLRPSDDPVRFGQEPSMTFAPSSISFVGWKNGSQIPKVDVNFFGLFGPNGPLPLHLTEYARDRLRNNDDPTLCRFLDLFHHRFISLFYKAWATAQPTVNFDRPEGDKFTRSLGSLIGFGQEENNADTFPITAKLFYAGRYSPHHRNVEGLLAVIRDYFAVSAELEEFVGAWIDIPVEHQMQLGRSVSMGSLGLNTVIGSRAWECQHKFRLKIGSLTLNQYNRFLPGGDSLTHLIDLVRSYVGDELEWDIKLILKKEFIPAIRLDSACRLGWDSWLVDDRLLTNADHLLLRPMDFAI